MKIPNVKYTSCCSQNPTYRSPQSFPRVEDDFHHFQKMTTGTGTGEAQSQSPTEKRKSQIPAMKDKGKEEVREHCLPVAFPGGRDLPQLKNGKSRLNMSLSCSKDPQGNTRSEFKFLGFCPKEALSGRVCLEKVLPKGKIFGFH